MERKSRGLMTPEQIADMVPADLAGMLSEVKQDFYDEFFGTQSFTLVFNYNDKYDLILNMNHEEYGDFDDEEKVLENASYSLFLYREIIRKSPVLFPFVANDTADFGCFIPRHNYLSDSDLSDLQKDNMVWDLRKAFSIEEREWYLKRWAHYAGIYFTGAPPICGREFSIAIPYSCPKRHYLSILRNLDLWQQLKQSWDWPSHGAFGLFEKENRDGKSI